MGTSPEVMAASQEAVLVGDEGEAVEGVAGAGAGVELGGPADRAGNHLSGELGVNMLRICWPFLEGCGRMQCNGQRQY